MDNLESVSLSLPGYPDTFITLHYYDSSPNATNEQPRQPTIIAAHGSPGSHLDFKYMVPSLLTAGYRVIIPNWPGFGITDNPPEALFNHSNLERAQLLTSFVKALNLKKIDVAVGHSAGCYPYPPFFCDNPGLCVAAVFITPGGATPHKSMRPYWVMKLVAMLLNTWLKPVISYLVWLVTTKVFGFKITHYDQAALLSRIAANIDFTYLNSVLLMLKETKNPPIVLVCGNEDHLVEKEKSIEYAEKLGCHEHDGIFHIEKSEQIDDVVANVLSHTGRLDRHYAVLFERGSHFLQKHEAGSICKLIYAVITANKKYKL